MELADLAVDFLDLGKLAQGINAYAVIDGSQASRKDPGFLSAIVFFDVLAGAGDGVGIEQLEVVEAEHADEFSGVPLFSRSFLPLVETGLSLAHGGIDAVNTIL